jgi:hypothetical protein
VPVFSVWQVLRQSVVGVCSDEVQRGSLKQTLIANRRSGRQMRDLPA